MRSGDGGDGGGGGDGADGGDGGGGGDGGDVFFSSEVLNIWKIGWEKYDVD